MNQFTLRKVIIDQKEEIELFSLKNFVKRDAYDKAINFIDDKIIKVIMGVRRCGKSTFAHQLLKGKNYAYINFDDERLLNLKSEDLNTLLELLLELYGTPEYILFDEIQNVYGWEMFVNRLYRNGYKIILTGSNSKMLSKELATHLTGRHISIELYPFSYTEFLRLKGIKYKSGDEYSTSKSAKLKSLFNEYLSYGGFPEVYMLESKFQYLRELYEMIIHRDIVDRYEIRYIKDLKEISLLLMNYFSSKVSYQKISKLFDIKSANTVKNYLGYFEETYLYHFVKPFTFKHKEQLKQPRKVYCIDNGMINALATQYSGNQGKFLENMIFIHELSKGKEIYYYKVNNHEIDFVIRKGNKFDRIIQVSFDISETKTLDRESRGFARAMEELKCSDLYIITENTEDELIFNGMKIKVIPAWKYLLSD